MVNLPLALREHDALLNKIKDNNSSNTRIFTFGIGTEINTHLLDQMTRITKGYRTYVLPEEDLELKLSSFYTKVSSPVLSNLKLDLGNQVYDVYPKELPDLFKVLRSPFLEGINREKHSP